MIASKYNKNHAKYGILPSILITLTLIRIKLTCHVIIVTKNWLICNGWRLINFCTKRLSEGPYLKSSISRVFCRNCKRFCSLIASVICLQAQPFFLATLHRAVSIIAVNSHIPCITYCFVYYLLEK